MDEQEDYRAKMLIHELDRIATALERLLKISEMSL